MGKIIIKRLLQTIPTLLVVVTQTFCLTRMLPGDPAVAILGIEANAEDIEAMRAEMNLDKPLPEQYALYLNGLVHGDFGYSYSYRQDVLPLITSRIPNTLTLTLTARFHHRNQRRHHRCFKAEYDLRLHCHGHHARRRVHADLLAGTHAGPPVFR